MNNKYTTIICLTIISIVYLITIHGSGFIWLWIGYGIWKNDHPDETKEYTEPESIEEADGSDKFILSKLSSLAIEHPNYKFEFGYDEDCNCYVILYKLNKDRSFGDPMFPFNCKTILELYEMRFRNSPSLYIVNENSSFDISKEYATFNDK